MEQAVKQRVVGAVVLVALGVIFIPILLEGPEDNAMPKFSAVPEAMVDLRAGQIRPTEQALALPEQTVTTVVIETPSKGPSAAPKAAPPPVPPKPALVRKAPAPTPAASDASQAAPATPHGWVVQLGSFGNESNALGLRDRMRKAGYASFVERVVLDTGTLYRVRVGPELKRERAEQLQRKIVQAQGIEGRVMSHP